MILRELPVGARVREKISGLLFLVGEHNHKGYNGTTLVSNNVIGQFCLDAPEEYNPDERLRLTGYNYYAFSNLHQWLNACGNNWYQPAHEYDAAPTKEEIAKRPNYYDRHGYNAYKERPGFLSWFGDAFREAIYESDVPCIDREQKDIEFIKGRVFLLSAAEVGIALPGSFNEGTKIAVFNDFRNRYSSPSVDAIANSEWLPAYYNADQLFWYWLRTPKINDRGFTCYAHNVNPYSYKFSCCPWLGLRPVVNVDSGLTVAESAVIRGLFLIG